MLTKPDLKDENIIAHLRDEYGLNVEKIAFLPLGADFNTAVYRITTGSQIDYFLKLRRGEFFEASVSVPKYLADSGFKQVIPSLVSRTGQLWANIDSFKAIIYPYVGGHNGIETKLSDQQWIRFGATIKKLHSINIPSEITNSVPKETFSPKWQESVKAFLERIENEVFEDLVAVKMAEFLKSKIAEVLKLIKRADELAQTLQKQPPEYVLCHADIHGWNLIIDKEGAIYIVDWDTLIFAPKERDLMFIGAGIWDSGRSPDEEESLFYQGYSPAEINQDAICYYRFERIIQDIGEYIEHIFLFNESVDSRMQSLEYLQSNFLSGGTIERAYQSYKNHMTTNISILKWVLTIFKELLVDDVSTIAQTPWSSILKINTGYEFVYLKHTPALIALEAKIIQFLSDKFRAPVPTVIAHNQELNCFLMKDAGTSLRGILKKKFDIDLLCKAIKQFTSLQITVADHVDDFINIGVPDWRLNKLPDLYKKAISQKELLIADGLSKIEVNELDTLLPKITYLCQKLSSYSIKQTIVQPDFSDNNILIDDKSKAITIIDVGEISISHPFFSLLNCLQQVKKHYALTENDDLYFKIKDACFKHYMNFEDEKNLLAALEIAHVLWFVYGLLAQDRLMQACGHKKLLAFQHGKLSGMLKEFIVICKTH